MVVYCHVVTFAETMEHDRDLEQEKVLEEMICNADIASEYLYDSDGEGREHDGPDGEGREDDGSGGEREDDDSSGEGEDALTVSKSGEVYILIKPLLTRCINCIVYTFINTSFFF